GRRGLREHRRAHQGHDHPRRREHLPARDRGVPAHPSARRRGAGDRRAERALRRGGDGVGAAAPGRQVDAGRPRAPLHRQDRDVQDPALLEARRGLPAHGHGQGAEVQDARVGHRRARPRHRGLDEDGVTARPPERKIDRVFDVGPSTPTEQVDRRRDVLPGEPTLTDPFIFLSEDWFSPVGFEWHPHRGFETVTYVVDGALEHRDNAGGRGVLGAGDLQWVTAGRGVLHAELAHERRPVHTLQLWLNLPAAKKRVAPRYQDVRGTDAPVASAAGVEARVFAGRVGDVEGPVETHWPTIVADVRLEAGARLSVPLPAEYAAFFYLLGGALDAGGRSVVAAQVGWSDPGAGSLELAATQPARLLLYASAPIREPIVAYGPFVMNRRDEIIEA